jgi:glycosyltransferase involved in cell wall biosynthesis
LHRDFGFKSEIVYSGEKRDFSMAVDLLSGLRITHAGSGRYAYVRRNAKSIDALMLFHISTKSILMGLLYKFLNPGGFLFLKADMTGTVNAYPMWGTRNFVTQTKRVLLYKMFIRVVDLITFECKEAFLKVANVPDDRKLLLPNGFDPAQPSNFGIIPRAFASKKNMVLVVARHGDPRKNTELMLEALEHMDNIGEWDIVFIGPMTREFERRKDLFLAQNPRYRKRVLFTGNIDDRRTLLDYYNRAKIICLPSKSESWGIACVEAMCFGVVPVMSNHLASARDITGNGVAGLLADVHDAGEWAGILTELIGNQDMLSRLSENALQHFRHNFVWRNILEPLATRITEERRSEF